MCPKKLSKECVSLLLILKEVPVWVEKVENVTMASAVIVMITVSGLIK